jgi:hypothetical protein
MHASCFWIWIFWDPLSNFNQEEQENDLLIFKRISALWRMENGGNGKASRELRELSKRRKGAWAKVV